MDTTQPDIDHLVAEIHRYPTASEEESAPGPEGLIVHHLGRAYEGRHVPGDMNAVDRVPASRIRVTRDGRELAREYIARGEDLESYLREVIDQLVSSSTLAGHVAHIERLQDDLDEAVRARDEAIRAALRHGMTQAQAARATGLTQQRVAQINQARTGD